VGVPLAKNACVMSQAFFGMKLFPLDVWHVKTTHMLTFDTREHMPDPFLGESGPGKTVSTTSTMGCSSSWCADMSRHVHTVEFTSQAVFAGRC
jgi:hypothetical protein